MIAATRLFFYIGLLTIVLVSFQIPNTGPDTIKTNAGPISGTVSKEGNIHIFKGIPFAAPPVGDLRWRAPQPVKAWTSVLACTAFGPSPMQAAPAPFSMWTKEFLIADVPISEDCLYLNVWTGAQAPKEKRPVIVWIYGGGFASGGTNAPIYDGEAMAKKGIVFVSINYRVGIFGFFAHPELTKESGNNASGNYGLLDQIAGLKWVKNNIAAFGGDPNNVTIAGQSAGSMSVNCLVASPLCKNLIQKAIAESGASFVSSALRAGTSLQAAEQDGIKTAAALKANSLAELRNIPAATLLNAPQALRGPIVDGYVLPAPIAAIFEARKENPVALLTGWNEDEGLLFGPVKNAADYTKDANEHYGTDAATFLRFYPAENDAAANVSQLNLSRDMTFGVQNYTWANKQSEHGSKVYVYRFTRKVPATGEYIKYGAFHTGEVPYAYDNLQFVNRPWLAIDHDLAKTMSEYWSNFAKTGNPNSNGLPEWPAYDQANKMIMSLGDKPSAKKLPDAESLDFILSVMKENK